MLRALLGLMVVLGAGTPPEDEDGARPARTVLSACRPGERDCGWRWQGLGRCQAGRDVVLRRAAGALRVCAGDGLCEDASSAALKLRAGTCGPGCLRAAFACPATGVYSVLTRAAVEPKLAPVGGEVFPQQQKLSNGERVLSGQDRTGAPVLFKVSGSIPDPLPGNADLALYAVSYWEAGGGWRSWCRADAAGLARAIPLAGAWDARGAFNSDDTLITFACTAGVLAKCVRWGYRPWQKRVGPPARELHLACARMARADYCGNGRSHTREGTEIEIQDVAGIRSAPFRLPFEGAWGPEGALCLGHLRWPEERSAVEAECPQLLTREHACTSAEAARARFPGALLFNASQLRAP